MADRLPERPAAGHELPAAQIAHCGGWTDVRRRGWAKQGLLRERGPFTTHDAVETAICAQLAVRTNQNAATRMWKVVRADVRRLTVAGRDDIWIVASASHPAHAVACVGASSRLSPSRTCRRQ